MSAPPVPNVYSLPAEVYTVEIPLLPVALLGVLVRIKLPKLSGAKPFEELAVAAEPMVDPADVEPGVPDPKADEPEAVEPEEPEPAVCAIATAVSAKSPERPWMMRIRFIR